MPMGIQETTRVAAGLLDGRTGVGAPSRGAGPDDGWASRRACFRFADYPVRTFQPGAASPAASYAVAAMRSTRSHCYDRTHPWENKPIVQGSPKKHLFRNAQTKVSSSDLCEMGSDSSRLPADVRNQ